MSTRLAEILGLNRHLRLAIQDIWSYQHRGARFLRGWRIKSAQRLVDAGLATYTPSGAVLLTDAGIKLAHEMAEGDQ
jgi:hypothetical protein